MFCLTRQETICDHDARPGFAAFGPARDKWLCGKSVATGLGHFFALDVAIRASFTQTSYC
jgi:hypothetical protein